MKTLILILLNDSTFAERFFSQDNQIFALYAVITGTVVVLIAWIAKKVWDFFTRVRKDNRTNTDTLWQFRIKAKTLQPGLHLNVTNYKRPFFQRNSFEEIYNIFVNQKKHLIISGRSGLGKSRTVFELLSKLETKTEILIPKFPKPEDYDPIKSFKKLKRVILLLDDLQKYEISDIQFYIENLKSVAVDFQFIATCRSEYDEKIYADYNLSNLKRIALTPLSIAEGKSLAKMVNVKFNSQTFDNTAGSILYDLERLKVIYKQLEINQRLILEMIKLLKALSLNCDSGSVKEVAQHVYGFNEAYLKHDEWRNQIKRLRTMGFFDISTKGDILINDVYLSRLIEIDFLPVFKRYYKYLIEIKNSGALFYCGLYLESIDNFDFAEKCYNIAVSLYPRYSSAYYRLGMMYLKKAEHSEHALEYNNAGKFISQSIEYFLMASSLKSIDVAYHITLGYAYTKAAAVFDKTLDKKSEKKNLLLAIEVFGKTLNQIPKNASVARMRGFCYFQLEEYEKAMADYNSSISFDPFSPHPYYLLGLLYIAMDDDAKAIENYKKCLMRNPNFYQAYNNIGHIFSKRLQNPQYSIIEKESMAKSAIGSFLNSIRLSKGKHIVAYANLGHVYETQNRHLAAIKSYSIAIKKSPNYGAAYVSRGYALIKLLRFDEAESDLLKAIKLGYTQESLYQTLSFLYQKLGEKTSKGGDPVESDVFYKKALSYYEELLENKDIHVILSAKLGMAITYEKMGEIEKSTTLFRELLKNKHKNSKIISSAIQHITSTNNVAMLIELLEEFVLSVELDEIRKTDRKLLKEFCFFIQRCCKAGNFNINFLPFIEKMKVSFPEDYIVYKTSGFYYLYKVTNNCPPATNYEYVNLAETDFKKGLEVAPFSPVLHKYYCITNSVKCDLLKTNKELLNSKANLDTYLVCVEKTKLAFDESIRLLNTFIYPEIKVEYAIFLRKNNRISESSKIEKEAIEELLEQVNQNQKTMPQVEEELKELNSLKTTSN